MPKCAECIYLKQKTRRCKIWRKKIKITTKDLPCSSFIYNPLSRLFDLESFTCSKMKVQIFEENELQKAFQENSPFFPFWISNYLVQSIYKYGNISKAFEIFQSEIEKTEGERN